MAQAVICKLKIETALKRELSGEIEVVTGFGSGDCGIPGLFLAAIGGDRAVEMEEKNRSGLNYVDMCGYAKVMPMPK